MRRRWLTKELARRHRFEGIWDGNGPDPRNRQGEKSDRADASSRAAGSLRRTVTTALTTLLTLAFLGAGSAAAQDISSGKWWKNPRIAKELKLTSGDVGQLDRLFTSSRRRLIQLKNAVEKEQFEYQNLMEKPNLDEAAVRRQFRRLEEARTRLSEEKSQFMVGVRKILGAQRFQMLKDIYRRGG